MNFLVLRYIALIFVLLGCHACSINGWGVPGTVNEKIINTNSARVISTQAKGLHLYTRDSFGIHMGYLEREIVYPVISDNSLLCADLVTPVKPGNPDIQYSDDAIQVKHRYVGMGIDVSPHNFNAKLGLGHKKMIRVDANSSFSMLYNNKNQQHGTEVCAVIQPTLKGRNHEN